MEHVARGNNETLPCLDPQFPFIMTKFELVGPGAQSSYPHRHDHFEILYIKEGEGTHVIDFEPHPVTPNTFYFLSKDQIHFWQLTKPLTGYILLLTEDFLNIPSSNILRAHDFDFFQHVEHAPYLSLSQETESSVSHLLEGIEGEFHQEAMPSLSVLRAYMHILFTQLKRLYALDHPNNHSETASSLVHQFTQLVSENYLSEHSVHHYADKMGISTSHLTDTIKAVTGQTPGNIIRHKLALEAKRFLVHSNATIAEIGYRLNFEDASYFGRFFKRETGMSPAVFRKDTREKYQITIL